MSSVHQVNLCRGRPEAPSAPFRAFTIVELIVAIAITLILAGIIYPVLRASVNRSKESVCASTLRNAAISLQMYRSDHDGDGKYGTPREMGMPGTLAGLSISGYLQPTAFACNGSPGVPDVGKAVFTSCWHGWDDKNWSDNVLKHFDHSITFWDENHGNRPQDFANRFAFHRGIGVYLDTSVKTIRKQGDWGKLGWWQE